jgi:hypothetical protein
MDDFMSSVMGTCPVGPSAVPVTLSPSILKLKVMLIS